MCLFSVCLFSGTAPVQVYVYGRVEVLLLQRKQRRRGAISRCHPQCTGLLLLMFGLVLESVGQLSFWIDLQHLLVCRWLLVCWAAAATRGALVALSSDSTVQ